MSGGEAVRARRARLIERADREREDLSCHLDTWMKPLRVCESGFAVYRGFRSRRPAIGFTAAIGMAALAFVRPEGISSWVRSATDFWGLLTETKRGVARAGKPAATAPPPKVAVQAGIRAEATAPPPPMRTIPDQALVK